MPWPSDTEPEDKLHKALFVIEETRGYDQTIAFLQQELSRLRVVANLRNERHKLLPAPANTPASAPAESARGIAAAVEALKFYGEETFYETPKTGRDKRSAIAKDGGFIAREALATLAEDDDEGAA